MTPGHKASPKIHNWATELRDEALRWKSKWSMVLFSSWGCILIWFKALRHCKTRIRYKVEEVGRLSQFCPIWR